MSEDPRVKGLGRGLSALFGEQASDLADADRLRAAREVPIAQLRANPRQPRRLFDEAELESLVQSIRAQGILQPILVRRVPGEGGAYEIVAGERRWRAAQRAQLHHVPVLVRDLTDSDALGIALIENLQRQDLTALEEADAYARLAEEFGQTQDQIARAVGKSRSHVANMLRLLGLPEPVRAMLADGRLTAGHARPLVGHADAETLANAIVARGLNVRQAEELGRAPAHKLRRRPKRAPDPNTRALERDLSAALGLGVSIADRGTKGGVLAIRYQRLDQLDEVCRRLCLRT
ncbi:MAG: ParB/RepB/Spo0J family partition protein [Alphaproteobacteria bacterium]|nr:ParB/RepB/Spo0J family partition protein [Alphaproteobacteria bacterium]